MRPWFCAMTAPRLEAAAQRGLAQLGVPSFLPAYLTRDASRHIVPRMLFRGYIFVGGDPRLWPRIRDIPGIINVLTYLPADSEYRMPSGIASAQIEQLSALALSYDEIRREGGNRVVRQPIKVISAGCYVRIKSGVFRHEVCAQRALVDWADPSRARLLLKMFNREIEAEFYLKDLERVP